MRRLLFFLMFSMVTFFACAQELWLEASQFVYAPADSLKINFKTGVDFIGNAWRESEATDAANKRGLKTIALHQQNKFLEMRRYLRKDEGGLVIPPQTQGTCLIVLETQSSFREFEPDKFNSYLREAALDDAYYQRQKTNALDKNGSELYTHFAKLLTQVGKQTDDTFRKEVSLTVEIIPMQNPYLLKVGDRVQFKIMYEGKPLFGARVKVWNRHNNRTSVQNIFTEQNGMIETHISNPGAWMVSVIKMIPSKDAQADWQSYQGSLTFGINIEL